MKKVAAAISPLCSPSYKVVVTTSPKLTISTQPVHAISTLKSGEVSPLPSRALHGSPLSSVAETVSGPGPEVILRKHSKQSLSQPTIPEEGPEHSEEAELTQFEGPSPLQTLTPVSVLRPKPELKVVKTLSQESTGAISKDTQKKSGSGKDDRSDPAQRPPPSQEASTSTAKSPKTTRQESVERLFKAIRGTGRHDSKSKKRENSLSPSSQSSPVDSQGAAGGASNNQPHSGKANKKEGTKKNAQEKRDIFKSLH